MEENMKEIFDKIKEMFPDEDFVKIEVWRDRFSIRTSRERNYGTKKSPTD